MTERSRLDCYLSFDVTASLARCHRVRLRSRNRIETRQMGRNCKAAELRTRPAYLSNEIGLHEKTAVEVSRTVSAMSRLVRVHGPF